MNWNLASFAGLASGRGAQPKLGSLPTGAHRPTPGAPRWYAGPPRGGCPAGTPPFRGGHPQSYGGARPPRTMQAPSSPRRGISAERPGCSRQSPRTGPVLGRRAELSLGGCRPCSTINTLPAWAIDRKAAVRALGSFLEGASSAPFHRQRPPRATVPPMPGRSAVLRGGFWLTGGPKPPYRGVRGDSVRRGVWFAGGYRGGRLPRLPDTGGQQVSPALAGLSLIAPPRRFGGVRGPRRLEGEVILHERAPKAGGGWLGPW